MMEAAPLRADSNPSDRRPRVLVVDDHADALKLLAVALSRWDYDVIPAPSLAAARDAAAAGGIDLLVCDLRLPDGCGTDVMRSFHHPVPGIVLSGADEDQDFALSRDAGFAAHLTKPVDLLKLRQALDALRDSAMSAAPAGSLPQAEQDLVG